jgi:hypothetical protein
MTYQSRKKEFFVKLWIFFITFSFKTNNQFTVIVTDETFWNKTVSVWIEIKNEAILLNHNQL